MSQPGGNVRDVANLRPEQHAGSQRGLVDLPSYISGYIDGEGCFAVSISPCCPTLLVRWEVRPSLSVSQNGDRREVLLMMQQYFACGTVRPDRSDRTVKWETRSLPSHGEGDPALPSISIAVRQASRLRTLRERLRADGSGRASPTGRLGGDRSTGRQDESEWQARTSGGDDPREHRRDEGIVCPSGNRGLW
jgi:hypothetical protein